MAGSPLAMVGIILLSTFVGLTVHASEAKFHQTLPGMGIRSQVHVTMLLTQY